ncbi:MAG TPA: hypothetical protein VMU99_03195 [Acidimicrobiales bacterium]|nr:hypothetical protein [Acidimicrobiales bacterium]
MAGADGQQHIWVITIVAVQSSVEMLLNRRVHPGFLGYLHYRQIAAENGKSTGIQPEIHRLEKYLKVPGGPSNKPYFRPIWHQANKAGRSWMNDNLAGSYQKSSLRPNQPLTRVVNVPATDGIDLPAEHWVLAREHLLYGDRLPALALAGYLLRNFGFYSSERPNATNLIGSFRDEFGYASRNDDEFDHLFSSDPVPGVTTWFEQTGSSSDEPTTVGTRVSASTKLSNHDN